MRIDYTHIHAQAKGGLIECRPSAIDTLGRQRWAQTQMFDEGIEIAVAVAQRIFFVQIYTF